MKVVESSVSLFGMATFVGFRVCWDVSDWVYFDRCELVVNLFFVVLKAPQYASLLIDTSSSIAKDADWSPIPTLCTLKQDAHRLLLSAPHTFQ